MKDRETEIISRKTFLSKTAVGVLGAGLVMSSCTGTTSEKSSVQNVSTGKKYRWNMVTTWPPNLPVLTEGLKMFAQWVDEMSVGQLQIKVYGGGELIPALEAFDAVSSGTAEIGSGASYYWSGKSAATQFFAAIPFGLNAQQMNAWLYSAGGMQLWEEVYAPFNVIPMPGGNTGVQMGGWFNRRINNISDLKGLKMRIPGLGGKVLVRAGGTAVLSAGSEIYTNLERGVIDATEWIGPYHDYLMGFHQIADYYYYPGWHEPGTVLEIFVNKFKFEQLPNQLKVIVRTAAARLNIWMLSEFEARNAEYLQKIKSETDVEILSFPDDVIAQLKSISNDVIDELVGGDALSKKVYEHLRAFKKQIDDWASISEKKFYSGF
jgi:TRAP-type mannitol/chloroaromatic compound transport system substrate-binding protein